MKKLNICLLVIVCLFMVGCTSNKTKETTTLENFSTELSNNNFQVVLKDYSNIDYIVESRVGTYNDIEIEMIKYTDSSYADKVHGEHIESFNLLKSTGAAEVKDKGKNYYKYSLVSNGYYMISSRVDDTLIFCKTSINNKDLVDSIYTNLGY